MEWVRLIRPIVCSFLFSFIYRVHDSGELYADPLFPFHSIAQSPIDSSRTSTIDLPTLAAAITVDYSIGKLIIVAKNGSVYAYDLVDGSVQDARSSRLNGTDSVHSDARKVLSDHGRLFWISTSCGTQHAVATCLYSEEERPDTTSDNERLLNLNKYLYSSHLVDITWLGDWTRPGRSLESLHSTFISEYVTTGTCRLTDGRKSSARHMATADSTTISM